MKLEEIKKLRLEVIRSKVLYEEALKIYEIECKKQYTENNLSMDDDKDLDRIVDIDMKLSEKYGTDVLYKLYTKLSDDFILNSLQWLVDNPPANTSKAKIKVLTDLLENLKADNGTKLMIYRDKLLDICLSAESFMEVKA